mmetsp:Transcript_37233/g.106528  ORF Transcript_37233/g.106528 Transcript_37233/m.106528 type:complete len:139 (+) Transcript_37233:164-580(+)
MRCGEKTDRPTNHDSHSFSKKKMDDRQLTRQPFREHKQIHPSIQASACHHSARPTRQPTHTSVHHAHTHTRPFPPRSIHAIHPSDVLRARTASQDRASQTIHLHTHTNTQLTRILCTGAIHDTQRQAGRGKRAGLHEF